MTLDRDFTILLVGVAISLLFVAYEMAGLTIPGWHTISYYASHNQTLRFAISCVMLLAGPISGAWFIWHTSHFIPR